MDLGRVKKKASPASLATTTVFFSSFGGLKIGWGIQQLVTARLEYRWIESFLTGLAFLYFGIFWAVLLVKRTKSDHAPRRPATDAGSILRVTDLRQP